MREIGISPRFSRDKFVPLQTKQRYSTRDISGEVSLTLFFRGFVPFLSLADFVSRNKNLQVADLQRLKSCFGELVTATTSNHQKEPCKHEVIDYEYFRDFDRKKAFNAATNFAANIYKPDSAKVESFYTYVHAPYESYRIECSYGGDLIDCTSEDATCPMCNSNS